MGGNGLVGAAMGLGVIKEDVLDRVFEEEVWEGWEVIGLSRQQGRRGR